MSIPASHPRAPPIAARQIPWAAAAAIREMIESLSGPLHVTLEETTQAEWLYEVIRDLVSEVVVCDPRRNKLLPACR